MQTTFTKLENMQIGAVAFGFQLMKKQTVDATAATLYTLRHQKTGAELLYSSRASENKTFFVAFQTLPEDDTGVFHILEHSVLCGSKKYPVKEPFVVLLQSSMQTFLNAMTYGDKTVYPVCSRNEQDFRNLVSVYLDAVFCPAIYDKPEIFMQEGWHYELDTPETVPSYNGVVFSEMKGAFSEVEDLMAEETMSLLFPDNCYHFCSGGHPKHIPELSYQEFIQTHQRFYHPSNAKFFLDGTMDIGGILQYIDEEYLSQYDYRAPDFAITAQNPVVSTKRVSYQADPNQENLSHFVLAKIFCGYEEIEKIYAAKILCDYLTGSNEAPLQRAVLEAGLGQDVVAGFADGIYQPYISFKVRNTKPEHFDTLCWTLQDAISKLCEAGLDRDALSACLERYAFRCQEIDEPYGLELGLKTLDTWLYGGDPVARWDMEKIFDSLRERLSGDYFADLLREAFGNPETMCRLEFVPSDTKAQEDEQQEKEKLQAQYQSWDADQKKEILAGYENLLAWQKMPDTPEAMAHLPKLNLQDIPLIIEKVETRESELCGRKLWRVETNTHGIVYANFFFRLGDFTTEELQMANLLTSVLGELSTAQYSALELQSQMKTWLGSLDARVETIAAEGEIDNCTPYLLIGASMLEENAQKGMALLEEILCHTVFTEADRVEEMLRQSDYALHQALIGSGHSFAITKALAPFSVAGTLQEALSGETAVRWVSALTQNFPQEKQAVMESLQKLCQRIFCRNRLSVGVGGNISEDCLRSFVESLAPGDVGEDIARSCSGEKTTAVEIPSGVSYCGMGHNLYTLGEEFTGAAAVLGTMLSYGYLWNTVRVQGGAYGTGMAVRANGDMFCYSYRDPNPEATLETFRGMVDYLEEACRSEMALEDTIIGTVGKTDPLLAPGGLCRLACQRCLKGTTYEKLCKTRKEILTTTKGDLRKLASALRGLVDTGAVCVVGGKTQDA